VRVESSCELVLWVQFSLQSQTFCLFVAKPLAFENEVLTFFFWKILVLTFWAPGTDYIALIA